MESVMDFRWQSRRAAHRNDDLHSWRYQQGVPVSERLSDSPRPSDDGGNDMDYYYLSSVMDDSSSEGLGCSV
jgi:hypothetical protein